MNTLASTLKDILVILIFIICFLSLVYGAIGYFAVFMSLRDGDFAGARSLVLWANLGLTFFLMIVLVFVRLAPLSNPVSPFRMKITALSLPGLAVLSILKMDAIGSIDPLSNWLIAVGPLTVQILFFVWAVRGRTKGLPSRLSA